MARKKREEVETDTDESEDETEEEVEDEDEEEGSVSRRSSGGRGPQPPRISVTLPARIRRKVRIAAAKHDMEISDWCKTVIVQAAVRTVEKYDIE